jgi:hypothetical protein
MDPQNRPFPARFWPWTLLVRRVFALAHGWSAQRVDPRAFRSQVWAKPLLERRISHLLDVTQIMLLNSDPGLEIGLQGRISVGFLSGNLQNRLSEGGFQGFADESGRNPAQKPDVRPGSAIA